MKKLFIFFTILILSTNTAFAASDYLNEIGNYAIWPKKQLIKVYVDKNSKSAIAYKALKSWDDAGGGCFHFYNSSQDKAGIKIYYVESIDNNLPSKTDYTTNGKYMTSANVYIAYKKPGTNHYQSQEKMFSYTLHEVGHALGLLGYTTEKNSIMNAQEVTSIHYLQLKDRATIQKLYCHSIK